MLKAYSGVKAFTLCSRATILIAHHKGLAGAPLILGWRREDNSTRTNFTNCSAALASLWTSLPAPIKLFPGCALSLASAGRLSSPKKFSSAATACCLLPGLGLRCCGSRKPCSRPQAAQCSRPSSSCGNTQVRTLCLFSAASHLHAMQACKL